MPRASKQALVPSSKDDIYLWNHEKLFAGVDEAGRGCIAGPVVAAAVILPLNFDNKYGINDSKQVSPAKRNELFDIITGSAVAYGIGMVDNNAIDTSDILKCTMAAMHAAINKLMPAPEFLLIDGNYFLPHSIPHKTIVGGDSLSLSIASASILAKVTRDRLMVDYHNTYPDYQFDKHKGYGTRAHYAAIDKNGPCPIHRLTFLRKYYSKQTAIFDDHL